jgi:hypothetical protein
VSGAPSFDPGPMTRAQLQEFVRIAWAKHADQGGELTDHLSNAHADLAHALGVTRDPGSPVVEFGGEASIQHRETPLSLEAAATRALASIEVAFNLALTSQDWLHEALRADSVLRDTDKEGGTK